jgi:serine/threonine protein kinase
MSSNLIGQILLDQFRVDAFIASGGMGVVYRVWDLNRNVNLAMKVLHAELAEDPSIFKRFQREARALQKLAHPNIIQFYGLFRTADFAFILERFIDGPTLKDILRNYHGQPMPPNETLSYLKALSAALGYAHVHGVVHCDVKPGNVMIDKGGVIYLTDFGIARHAESTTTTLATVGTAAYMAPEQIQGDPVNPATDVYALGVLLFKMLTGQRPFRGSVSDTDSMSSTAGERIRYEHLHVSPPDPKTINPNLSDSLAQVLLKALSKDPEERYSDIQTLFSQACSAIGVSPAEVEERVSITELPQPYPRPWVEKTADSEAEFPKTKDKRTIDWRRPPIIGAFGLIAFIVIILIWTVGTPPPPPPAFTQTPTNMDEPTQTVIVVGPGVTETQPTPTSTDLPIPTKTPTPTNTPIIAVSNPMDIAELIHIPSGEFIMGSDKNNDPYWYGAEGPSHRVYLEGYWIYRTEVTNRMYQTCVEQHACPRPAYNKSSTRAEYFSNPAYDNYPVIFVSSDDAISYCRWAGGRLPTEAEWEKAARGEDSRLFAWGNQPPTGELANYCDRNCSDNLRDSSQDDGYRDTSPAGNYPKGSSPYGLLDMAGNVWEWTSDWFDPVYYKVAPLENPLGPASGQRRVVRGGSWYNPAEGIRTVNRRSERPGTTTETLGFRCVVEEADAPAPDSLQPKSNSIQKVAASAATQKEILSTRSIWGPASFRSLDQPGSLEYSVFVNPREAWIWDFAWCAVNQDKLNAILRPLSMNFLIDETLLAPDQIFEYEGDARSISGWRCHYFVVFLENWQSGTTVNLEISYKLSKAINDGDQTYSAGAYQQIIVVKVN